MTRTAYRTCPLCEATCGLELEVDGDRVTRVRGDADDVFSHGFVCPKGAALAELHHDPDRLRTPMIRAGDDWREVTWDAAFAEVARRLPAIQADHGRDSVAVYLGNPNVHNLGGALYVRPLLEALRTRNLFTASTLDQMPKHVSSGLLFGGAGLIPVPDLDRTAMLVILGANPVASNGSLATAPDWPGRLKALKDRGGRLVVVDPVRTRTAELADTHLAIRPGGDAALLAAVARVLFDEDRVRLRHLEGRVDGLEALREALAPFTPEATAQATGLPPEVVRGLARDLASAEAAAVYGRIGTHTVPFGTLSAWLVDVVNVLTGNLDRAGGAMFPWPDHEPVRAGGPGGRGFKLGRYASRVRGLPEVKGELPAATLADEIETEGEGQVRALVTVAGNPVLSAPNGDRLDRALAGLELMVSVDPYLNETTRHAHVILPPPSPLASPHYDVAFYAFSVRRVAHYSPPVFEREGPGEDEILMRLAAAAGGAADADPSMVEGLVLKTLLGKLTKEGGALAGRDPAEVRGQLEGDTPAERLLDLLLRTGPNGDRFGADPGGLTLARLAEATHGIDHGPLLPRLPGILRTPSAKIELAAAPLVADLARLRASLDAPADGLVLLGRRHLRSNNSWMHNLPKLSAGKARCTLQVHPDDAARLGLVDGGAAKVTSRVGEVVATVEITDALRPGAVSLPHGFGHDLPGARLRVAAERPGVSANRLTDDLELDPLSGNAVLSGVPVAVTPVDAR